MNHSAPSLVDASRKKRLYIPPEYLVSIGGVLLAMFAVWAFTGKWPTGNNPYNSYTLQACAWLEGRLDLGQDYPWLELAIYGGKYYVSFPPFPSFVLLPFAAVFGQNTPDHWISMVFTLLGVIYAVKLFRLMSGTLEKAERYVLFLFLANGYLFLSIQGWVWFLAQVMCFPLCLMSIYYAVKGRGVPSLLFWACAVGCRPMVVIYFPLLAVLLYRQWKQENKSGGFFSMVRRKWYWGIAPVVIALVYMMLNSARFGNPIEFGHNYLPEFQRAEHGQFSLHYLLPNLTSFLRLPGTSDSGALHFGPFGGNTFWLIAPIFIGLFAVLLYAARHKERRRLFELIALPLMLLAHLLILCAHRTLGGYQFGNRYIVDLLPFAFYGLLLFRPQGKRFHYLMELLFILGFAINLIGTVAVFNHWI